MKLRNLLTIVAFAVPVWLLAQPKVYYVVPGDNESNNDGSSWENAFTIHDIYAKEKAAAKNDDNCEFKEGDIFYFAKGTYYVGTPNAVSQRFYRSYVWYGGLDPNEGPVTSTPTYPRTEQTIFTGDLDENGVPSAADASNLIYLRRADVINDNGASVVDNLYQYTGTAERSKNIKPFKIYGFDFTCTYNTHTATESNNANGYESAAAGAVFANQGSWIELYYCNVYNNTCAMQSAGVHIVGSKFKLSDCNIHDNHAASQGAGLRLHAYDKDRYSRGVVERCAFYNNTVTGKWGGAIGVRCGTIAIINSTITNNSAATLGGGVYLYGLDGGSNQWARARGYIINTTIAGNKCISEEDAWAGEDLSMSANPDVKIFNSIIAGISDNGTYASTPVGLVGTYDGDTYPTATLTIDVGTLCGSIMAEDGKPACVKEKDGSYVNPVNTYQQVFGTEEIANNGGVTLTLKPDKSYLDGLSNSETYYPAYAGDATLYKATLSNELLFKTGDFTVDLEVDQTGNTRNTGDEDDYGAGAYDLYVSHTTGIDLLDNLNMRKSTNPDNAIYDLKGRKLLKDASQPSSLPKGIYITKGKKYLQR